MQIIALINQKSGIGKTTCAINIGAGLNKLKKRVLLIFSSLNLSGAEIEISGMARTGRGFLFNEAVRRQFKTLIYIIF